MKVTRQSIYSGNVYTLDLPVTQEQLDRYERKEDLAQNIFPNLSPSQREFLMTGSTQEEWDEMFGQNDEDDDDD